MNYRLTDFTKMNISDYNTILMAMFKTLTFSKEELLSPIKIEDDKTSVDCNYGQFIFTLILYKPFCLLETEPVMDYVFLDTNMKNISTYINKINYHFRKHPDKEKLKLAIKGILEDLTHLAMLSSKRIGTTLDYYDLITIKKRNKRFNEILLYSIDKNKQIYDVLKEIDALTIEMGEILLKEDSCFKPYMELNSKIKESLVSIGYQPDIKGDVIETPVNTSFVRGLKTPIDYYICAIGARKAMILSHRDVSRSGYLTRKIQLLMINYTLQKDEDCGSEHYINVDVFSADVLKMIDRKYYLTDTGLKVINSSRDKHLIGTKIKLRSPMTCRLGEDKCCKTCYGKLSEYNDIFNIGILATLTLTSQFTQNLLSAKHVLKLDVRKIKWDSLVDKYFIIHNDKITVKPGVNIKFTINPKTIYFDEDTNRHYTRNITIIDGEESHEIVSLVKMYLNISVMAKDNLTNVPSSILKEFTFNTENNEFLKNLEKILSILDSKAINDIDTYDNLYNTITKILFDSNINLNSVHLELILSKLIRKANDLSERIDFNNTELEPYKLTRISKVIFNSNSTALKLSFEKISAHFLNPLFYIKQSTYNRISEFYN